MKKDVKLKFNDNMVTLEKSNMSGAELRQALGITENEYLVIEVENKPDIEILNENDYALRNGMELYTGGYARKIKIIIDRKTYSLETPELTGSQIKALANITDEFKLVKEVRNGADIVINDSIVYHLENKDMFFSAPLAIQNGTEVDSGLLPGDKEILEDIGNEYEIINMPNEKLIILKDYKLSPIFDQEKTDVLIKIPNGYPMAQLDMFWVKPYVKLKATSNYPLQADVFEDIQNGKWQRFSRHYPWRSNYNLGTHLSAVKDVLEKGRP